MKKKILFITGIDFWNQGAGHRARLLEMISYLAISYEITVAFVGIVPKVELDLASKNPLWKLFVINNKKIMSSSGYGKRLKKFLISSDFHHIIIEYIHNSFFLNYIPEGVPVSLDMHDIISERGEQFKAFKYEDAVFMIEQEVEIQILKAYDYIIVLCKNDLITVNRWTEKNNAVICSHPGSENLVMKPPLPQKILFVGSEYIPNKDAINHFLDNCWIHLLKRKNLELHICGRVSHLVIKPTLPSVILHGFVNDLKEYYRNAYLAINPVRFGAGIKIKNIESLSHGLPLVTTSHGARGIESAINECVLIGNNSEEIIAAIELLLNDVNLSMQFRKNARNYIQKNFTADACFSPLLNIIN